MSDKKNILLDLPEWEKTGKDIWKNKNTGEELFITTHYMSKLEKERTYTVGVKDEHGTSRIHRVPEMHSKEGAKGYLRGYAEENLDHKKSEKVS